MQNIHKIHIKNTTKATNKQVDFIESIESIKRNEKLIKALSSSVISVDFLNKVVSDNKTIELLKLVSFSEMSQMKNFLNILINGDKITLIKFLQALNKNSVSDSDLKNLAERIVVVHKMTLIKNIFSDERINSAGEAIKNYK